MKYLIRKGGAWYRPNSQGYTGSAIQAGRYTKEDAIDITHPNGPDGPRDGMAYIHEDDVICDDLAAYTEQAAEIDRLREALESVIDAADSFCDGDGYFVAGQVRVRARAALDVMGAGQ